MKGCKDLHENGVSIRVPIVRGSDSSRVVWFDGRMLFQVLTPLYYYTNTSSEYYRWIGTLSNPAERMLKWDNMLELARKLND